MNLNSQNSSEQFYFRTERFAVFFLCNDFEVYLIWLAIDYFSVSSMFLTLLDMVGFYLDTY